MTARIWSKLEIEDARSQTSPMNGREPIDLLKFYAILDSHELLRAQVEALTAELGRYKALVEAVATSYENLAQFVLDNLSLPHHRACEACRDAVKRS